MLAVHGQWRVGPSGPPIALDYSILPFIFEMQRIPRERWPAVFADLSVMECVALSIFHEDSND